LASGLKIAIYRATSTIQATLTSDALVRFTVQGKVIPGCAAVQSISSVATCTFRPSSHGSVQIVARVIGGSSSANLAVGISNRLGNR
jgi:hypothetical protein